MASVHVRAAGRVDRMSADSGRESLSERQILFVCLYANGLTMQEIANWSELKYKTVRNDLDAAKQIVGAPTMARLVVLSIAQGLTKVEGDHLIAQDS